MPRHAHKPTRPAACTGCRRHGRTEASTYICADCRRNPVVHDPAEIALTGGRWVRRGLTQYWEAA